jgi:hypothetical protein
MVKNRQAASRSVPFISYAPPAGTPGGVEVLSLTELHRRARSYNQKLWMLDLLKGATYPPS